MIESIRSRLFEMQDMRYRAFQSGLMPTVNPERIIGVRTPQLRAYAREIANTPQAQAFMQKLPHFYYEENNLHAFLIEQIRDYDGCIAALNIFLPHVDNWATCDMMSPKVLEKHIPALDEQINIWMASDHCYTVRYGMGMRMRYFLGEHFSLAHLETIAAVRSDEYYIRMMIAWYFATALAFQYDAAVDYIEKGRLDVWTHNKAIQKAVESNRIDAERKQYLKKLKISTR